MPAPKKISLSQAQRSKLYTLLSSSDTKQRVALRANIVILAADGLSNYKIASILNTRPATVMKWRNRFKAEGVKCLLTERPRGENHGGKNSEEQEMLRQLILRKTRTENPPSGKTHWTTRSMATAIGTTHSFVSRVWKQAGLTPNLYTQYQLDDDPNFEWKLRDIAGFYLSPPERVMVFTAEKKITTQLVNLIQPGLALKNCDRKINTQSQTDDLPIAELEALRLATSIPIDKHNLLESKHELLNFLKSLKKKSNPSLDLHIIFERHDHYDHNIINNWANRHPNVHMHPIPTRQLWMNITSRFIARIEKTEKIPSDSLANSGISQLRDAARYFSLTNNSNKAPKTWTASVKVSLADVARTNLPC